LWSNYFNGSAGYLSVANNAVFDFGTGDCTFEAWVFIQSYSNLRQIVYSQSLTTGANGYQFMVLSSGFLQMESQASSVDQAITATNNAIPLNTWTHVAFTRASGTNRLFVNGNLCTTTGTLSQAISTGGYPVYIGAYLYNGSQVVFNGYISNVRLVKGTAVYTAAFTPPTAPLTAITNTSLLTCQSNRFVDNSTNNFAITINGTPSVQVYSPFGTTIGYQPAVIGGSGYFNGSGDYLTLPANAAFSPGTSAFTIEFWYYPLASLTNAGIFDTRVNSTSTTGILIKQGDGASNGLVIVAYFNNATSITSASILNLNVWNHVAIVRNSSNSVVTYVNGVGGSGTTISTNLTDGTSNTPFIGRFVDASASPNATNGYISNFRMVNGTAVYSANFTPPTAPLPAIANTSILLSGTNGQIYDNGMMNNFITAGSAQVSTSVVKYGTGSIAFNGSTDYLTALNGTPFQFPGDFTVEAWVYSLSATGQANYSGIFDTRATNVSSTTGIVVNLTPSGYLNFYINGNNYTSATLLGANNWTHVALVRSGSTISMYQNGVSVASVSYATSLSSGYFWVGSLAGPAASGYWQGYIDELRISKGYARYTANFTPPTSQFPSTGPIPVPTPNVEYLVVAGGGGGGWSNGGGGGAGGYRTNTGLSVTTGSAITVTIGTGGAGSGSGHGSDGTVSVFGSITSSGGGGGGSAQSQGGPGNTGGSGGGGGNDYPRGTQTAGGTGNSGGYTPAEGKNGGASQGGGGGASTAGSDGSTNGVGGAGTYSSITGSSVARGGGGGGSTESATDPVLGGVGGGGNGQKRNSTAPGNGTVNTGGGGGGGANSTGGTGGSGFVAIRYTNDYLPATSTTGSPSITNTGGYWIYAWTSSGSITF
jgi:hypothetical protein